LRGLTVSGNNGDDDESTDDQQEGGYENVERNRAPSDPIEQISTHQGGYYDKYNAAQIDESIDGRQIFICTQDTPGIQTALKHPPAPEPEIEPT
tara:strand:- start:26194 stop:26475 length:282 start_codon:yes stop_codon:yes gene_type:complete